MRKAGRVLATVLTVLLVLSTVVAAAEEMYQGFRVVNVVVNGQRVQGAVPAINFHGSTLIPLRAAVEAIGAKVEWDANSFTATITAPTAEAGPSETEQRLTAQVVALQEELNQVKGDQQAIQLELQTTRDQLKAAKAELDAANAKLSPPLPDLGRGRTNPVPTGTSVTAALSQGGVNFTARLTITALYRGTEAWTRIYAANPYNDQPGADKEYILIKMKAEVLKVADPEAAVNVWESWFDAVSSLGRDYPRVSVVDPEPEFDTRLYQGASHEGWFAVLVDKADTAPLVAFGRDYQGRGGYWMQMKPKAASTTTTTPSTETSATAPAATALTLTQVKTPEQLATYLSASYGTVVTPLGTMKIAYHVSMNDRTFFPWDYWIRMEYEPTSFFLDMTTKNTVTAEQKAATVKILKDLSENVYKATAQVFPGKKVQGGFYYGWYKYPSIQAGYTSRRALTWQNYDDNLLASGEPYSRATLSTFHYEPRWDDYDL